MNRETLFRTLVALALVLAAACKSDVQLEVRRLPVHVAIIPIAEPTIGQVTPGEFEGSETDLRLDLDCDEITRAVADALEEYCFDRTTLLELDGAEEGRTIDAFERERALLAMARAQGADWILELALRYDPEIYCKNKGTFWLNYPLFLFAGPSNWFVQDIGYFADVELTATVYDMHAIGAVGGALGDPIAEVISVSSRFAGSELNFNDRSGGIGDYAKGILIPSGHLARESEEAGAAVRADIIAELRVQMVRSLQSRRDVLVRTESIVPIYVEPSDVRIARHGDGLRVQGRVLLREGSLARRVRAVRLDAGAEPVTIEPSIQSEAVPAGYAAFHFDASVSAAPDAKYLRLECEAGSRDKFVRSYTFRIPAEERPER